MGGRSLALKVQVNLQGHNTEAERVNELGL